MNKYLFLIILCCFFIAIFTWHCGNNNVINEGSTVQSPFLNHGDSAKYVGIETCKSCHADIYKTFIETGMGQSFENASHKKSSAKFTANTVIYDKFSDFNYHPFWFGDTLKIKEFRLVGKDTTFQRVQIVNYIVGSGQHTNSHLMLNNGFLTQMPLTFYTQKGQWDLPPGFENGHNTRFNRKIGLECMSCHNSYPDFVEGSENKFASLPLGIGCERCHGPGSVHVNQKTKGIIIDTAKAIDYSIVNPGKLSIDLQFDVCQRCHLQGNAVLKNNHSFYDFKPGQKLSDYISVFLPKYKNADDEFIMASHADRLKQSQCFIKSAAKVENSSSLRPYKNALTCVTCHNPHESVRFARDEFFNSKCENCHGNKNQLTCNENELIRKKMNDNCVSCHMPRSGSIDIPHVTVHDHYIRKPNKKTTQKKEKVFIGLQAINENNPSHLTKAQAYLNQYEKFDSQQSYLDSAAFYVNIIRKESLSNNLHLIIQLSFFQQNFKQIIADINTIGATPLLQKVLVRKSWDNKDAWLCYRVGEAYSSVGDNKNALIFYQRAVELAAYYPDFLNKLGSAYLLDNNLIKSKEIFLQLVNLNPIFAPGLSNLGYIYLLEQNIEKAQAYFDTALALDPDYELALLNKASVLLFQQKNKEAQKLLLQLLRKHPNNQKAKEVLLQLKNM